MAAHSRSLGLIRQQQQQAMREWMKQMVIVWTGKLWSWWSCVATLIYNIMCGSILEIKQHEAIYKLIHPLIVKLTRRIEITKPTCEEDSIMVSDTRTVSWDWWVSETEFRCSSNSQQDLFNAVLCCTEWGAECMSVRNVIAPNYEGVRWKDQRETFYLLPSAACLHRWQLARDLISWLTALNLDFF